MNKAISSVNNVFRVGIHGTLIGLNGSEVSRDGGIGIGRNVRPVMAKAAKAAENHLVPPNGPPDNKVRDSRI